jgi:hypothetical protein
VILTASYLEDRVQWHRAWAEMLRWLEEFEMKHVESIRSINSFETLMLTWDKLAAKEYRQVNIFYRAFRHLLSPRPATAVLSKLLLSEPHLSIPAYTLPK